MAVKTIIKRRNGTSWDTLRPETEVAQIVDIDAYVPDNLQDLDNVVLNNVQENDVLKFDGSNWVNGVGGGGTSFLDGGTAASVYSGADSLDGGGA